MVNRYANQRRRADRGLKVWPVLMQQPTGIPFWKHRSLLLGLLLIGAALRLCALGSVPPGLYHDEAYNGLDALNVLQGQRPLYFPANNGREPIFIYLIALSTAVLGRSPLAVRMPAFFIGFLTLPATYALARTLWGRRVGLWALGVASVTLWHVHLSRMGFRAVLLPLFTALFLTYAARGLRYARTRDWLAAGVLYGASWYTYIAVRFTPLALAALALYGYLYHREALRKARHGLLLGCGIALIVLAPLGLYTLRYPETVLARTGQVWAFGNGPAWRILLVQSLKTAGMLFIRGDRIWRHNLAWRPVWEPALGLACALGCIIAALRARRDAGAALTLIWTAVMALPTLLAEDAPHFLRAIGMLPTAFLWPALGLRWVEGVRRHPIASIRWLRTVLAALLLLAGLGSTAHAYFQVYAAAPLAHHWLEGGVVALAGRINALYNTGWDGERMRHGPERPYTVYVDLQLWQSWASLPFLVPEERVTFALPQRIPEPTQYHAYVVWPYRGWESEILSLLPHPAYVQIERGPEIQGDKDPHPYTVAMIVSTAPVPEIPQPIAHFEHGIRLRAALVNLDGGSSLVKLWWDIAAPLETDYIVYAHYLRDGAPIGQHDGPPGYGYLPTSRWQPGDLILDTHPLPGIVPDPTRDRLRIGLYAPDTGIGLGLLDENGHVFAHGFEFPVILEQP